MRSLHPRWWTAVLVLAPALRPRAADEPFETDVQFALDEIEKQCGHFFSVKDIDWKKVRKEFTRESRSVATPEEHHRLLWRLLARLEDGHAAVLPGPKGEGIGIAGVDPEQKKVSPGIHLCRIGKKIYVKAAFADARELGITPGMEVVKMDGLPAPRWLEQRIEELRDMHSFSTDQQAFFYATHWGLGGPPGTRLKLELRDLDRKKKKRTITYDRGSTFVWGPAFFPPGLAHTDDLNYGLTEAGWGYVHVRRCPGDLPEQMDVALQAVGHAPGLILDFRGNSGGGFDHDALLGRFVPAGHELAFGKTIASIGLHPYGGPIVVIVDGTVRSAGETASGMFKEDGRAYMIGESATAGMSSSKATIELPSGYFNLYVSVASNKARFQGGRGIEGVGIEPHEIVEFTPEDLAAGVDTLTRRAEELLADFPQGRVPYDPEDFGWEAGG